jgi:hypothetical protein
MSALVHGRNASNRKAFVCNSCLHPFSSEIKLHRHLPNCLRHTPQQVVNPNPLEESTKILKFREYDHCFELHLNCIEFVADFGSLFVDSQPYTSTAAGADAGNSEDLNQHVISGFCCLKIKLHKSDSPLTRRTGAIRRIYGNSIRRRFAETPSPLSANLRRIYGESHVRSLTLNVCKDD